MSTELVSGLRHSQSLSIQIDPPQGSILCDRIVAIASRYFPTLNEEIKAVFDLQFLPSTSHKIVQLCYLASIGESSSKSPCTQDDRAVFFRYQQKANETTTGFRLAPAIFSSTTMSCAATVFINLTPVNTYIQSLLIFAITSVINTYIVLKGVSVTGTKPAASLKAYDSEQDTISELKDLYKELALQLIILPPDLKKTLGDSINIEYLTDAAEKNSTLDEKRSRRLFKFLLSAVKYAKTDDIEQLSLEQQSHWINLKDKYLVASRSKGSIH